MATEQVEVKQVETQTGITPIVERLKAHGVNVYHFADTGDRVWKTPRIWFRGDDSEGRRAAELIEEFADERGYELGILRREWIRFPEYRGRPAKPYWVLVFSVPKNDAKHALTGSL